MNITYRSISLGIWEKQTEIFTLNYKKKSHYSLLQWSILSVNNYVGIKEGKAKTQMMVFGESFKTDVFFELTKVEGKAFQKISIVKILSTDSQVYGTT